MFTPSEHSTSYGGVDSWLASRAVSIAKAQVGKPYLWGAEGPDAFDCSGLMTYAYQKAGLPVSRWTTSALNAGTALTSKVSLSSLLPGDMLLFGSPVNHVGMYVGNGQMVSAPSSGKNVKIGSMGSPVSAVRVTGVGTAVTAGSTIVPLLALGGGLWWARKKGWI